MVTRVFFLSSKASRSWPILGNLSFIDQSGALDIATRLRAGRSGVSNPGGDKSFFFLLSKNSMPALGPP